MLGSFALNISCKCEASLFNTNIMQIQKMITMQLKYNTNKMVIRALEMPILQDYNTNAKLQFANTDTTKPQDWKYNIATELQIQHNNKITNTTLQQDHA